MGRRPNTLPQLPAVFSWSEGQALGLGHARHRVHDLEKTNTGLWTSKLRRQDLEEAHLNGMSRLQIAEAECLLRRRPELCISHVSALRILGLPVTETLLTDSKLHLTAPGREWRSFRPGVTGHRATLGAGDVIHESQLAVTSPLRTLLDIARTPGIQERELVAIGDALVRWPSWTEFRTEPWTTPQAITEYLDLHPGARGMKRLKQAIARVRIGADSPAETYLRLAIEDAKLDVPQLQIAVHKATMYSFTADLGYEELKIAVQYDGESHFSPERGAMDRRRDREFERNGWVVLRAVSHDYRENFRSFVAHLAEVLRERKKTDAIS